MKNRRRKGEKYEVLPEVGKGGKKSVGFLKKPIISEL